MHDEIQTSFDEKILIKDDEWVSVRVIEAARRIISRTSNRIFVGLPTCRDPAYRDLNIEFAVDIMVCANILLIFPNFLKPFVSEVISNVPKQLRTGAELLRPVLEERLAKEAEYGKDWPGKPNDLISWLIDATPTSKRTVEELSPQIIIINFGSIHTTSMAFTVAIMHKLDSVLKESQRLMGNSVAAMNRLCLKDFQFSDGTVVPAGTFASAASNAIHNDENIYPNANEFHGFRFAEMKSEEGEEMGQNMVKPNNEYMIFGNGKHACPGRFFAVNELKLMLVHCLLEYDFKFEDGRTEPPPPQWFSVLGVDEKWITAENCRVKVLIVLISKILLPPVNTNGYMSVV
ncbi:hypothetical protein D9758_005236 [Tetrapyrgos nigripes]|uniref:Cytochrome P450 n=1 Tax=Tetrapyrgos nigripes TaxID=182062 RepID=A0A8H5GWF9_9AGAR|nr:hypothetical protein D9758_005236 [Tetrapyrgos nigripes]